MLPDMDGLEAFRQIQKIVPKVPVIFITADGASDTAIEAMKLGRDRLSRQAAGAGESARNGPAGAGNPPLDECSREIGRRGTPTKAPATI